MKVLAVVVLALMMLPAAVLSQQSTEPIAPPEILTPPGGTMVTEINLSDADLLGVIKQAIPAFAQSAAGSQGEIGEMLKKVDLNALADAIAGVKYIRAMRFNFSTAITPPKVLDFYQKQFTAEDGWSRVLYDTSMLPKGAVAVYSHGSQEYAVIGADPARKSAFVVRTVGSVDIPKLAALAGQFAKFGAELEAKKAAAEPAPKKPAAKTPATKK